jgi:hypothetical protein
MKGDNYNKSGVTTLLRESPISHRPVQSPFACFVWDVGRWTGGSADCSIERTQDAIIIQVALNEGPTVDMKRMSQKVAALAARLSPEKS